MNFSAILAPLARIAAPVAGFALGGPAGGAAGGLFGDLFGGSSSSSGASPAAGGLASLFGGGPGRGQVRRDSARAVVSSRPGLLRLQSAIRATGYRSAQAIADAIRAYTLRDPQALADLTTLMRSADQYGGIGKAQGEQANMLGDALKLIFLGETVPHAWKPTVLDVVAAMSGPSSPALYTAQPSGLPSSIVDVTPASFSPAPSGGTTPMGTFTDSIATLGSQLLGYGMSMLNEPGRSSSSALPAWASALQQPDGSTYYDPNAPSQPVPYRNVNMAPSVFEPFRLTARGATAKAFVASNPASGAVEWFGPLGHPVLFSRDLAVVKRVRRISSRFGRHVGLTRRVVRRRGRR